jgi:hypothetical protein
MCDEHPEEDRANYTLPAAGAMPVPLLRRAADALQVAESDVAVDAPDRIADRYFVHPAIRTGAGVASPDISDLRAAFRADGDAARRIRPPGARGRAVPP